MSLRVLTLKGRDLPSPCPISAGWNADGSESPWTAHVLQDGGASPDTFERHIGPGLLTLMKDTETSTYLSHSYFGFYNSS